MTDIPGLSEHREELKRDLQSEPLDVRAQVATGLLLSARGTIDAALRLLGPAAALESDNCPPHSPIELGVMGAEISYLCSKCGEQVGADG